MKYFYNALQTLAPGCLILLYAATVHAHTGAGPHDGLSYGFLHPLSGLDHILTMIAVGLWSVQMSKKCHRQLVWLLPLIFVAAMGLGGWLGTVLLPFWFAEHGTALSLLITGFLIARTIYLPFLASALLIALFAICHGYAHGSEMPDGMAIFGYATGFMLATALLHLSGIGFALLAYRIKHDQWLRLAGVAVALSSGMMLMGGAG